MLAHEAANLWASEDDDARVPRGWLPKLTSALALVATKVSALALHWTATADHDAVVVF